MKTLSEAWDWYESVRLSLQQLQQIGSKYWAEIPWASAKIARDDDFKTLEAHDIEIATLKGLSPIDDLAIVVLFSVFESLVRQYLVEQLKPEQATLRNPILVQAAEDAVQGVEEGSFYKRVLDPLKLQGRVPADLVTEVNQVRDYRNWVAHGRRGQPKNFTTPRATFERLSRFLDAIGITVEPELKESEGEAGFEPEL